MFDFEDVADRFWNLPQKGAEESNREQLFIDDIIQKSHIEKEIIRNLPGVSTAFDGGAGAGRYSILLAKHGIQVTHFDISECMIEVAKEKARREGVYERIRFVKDRLGNLSAFADGAFDMVISIDAPVSYTYPNHRDVIADLIRIAKEKVLLSVSSRLGSLAYLLNPIQKLQYILDKDSSDSSVQWYIHHSHEAFARHEIEISRVWEAYRSGLLTPVGETKDAFQKGEVPWPVDFLFMPDELVGIMKENGLREISVAGPGAFARSIPNEVLVKIMNNQEWKKNFLDFCYEFDRQPSVAGLGKDNLLAVGDKVI